MENSGSDDANIAETRATVSAAKSLQDYGDGIIRTMCSRFGTDTEPTLEWGDFKQFFQTIEGPPVHKFPFKDAVPVHYGHKERIKD